MPAGLDPVTFAATLCARICHDLAGTMGALSGTLDMAASTQDADALALAQDCARDLSARLRLLRAAWSEDSDVPDLDTLAGGLAGAEKLQLDITALPQDLPQPHRRLAVCLMMLAAQALPRGGTVRIAGQARQVSAQALGPRTIWSESVRGMLHDPALVGTAATNVRDVAAAMAFLQAERMGMRLHLADEHTLTAIMSV